MRIHTTILVAGVAVVLTLRAPAAHACGRASGGYGGAYAAALLFLVTFVPNTAFTIWDIGTIGQDHSPAYGVAEVLVAGPQFGYAVANLDHGFPWWFAAWTGALSAHGLWTIGSALANAPATPEDGQSHAFRVGPALVPDGQKSVPGIGLTGRF